MNKHKTKLRNIFHRNTHESVAYTNKLKTQSDFKKKKKPKKNPDLKKLILFMHNYKQIENSNIPKNTNRSIDLTIYNNKPTS
jgi:hypothetical protein